MKARFDNPDKQVWLFVKFILSHQHFDEYLGVRKTLAATTVQYEGTRTTSSPATMLLVRTWHSWVWRLIGGASVWIIGCGRHPRQRLVGADWWDARPPPNMAHAIRLREPRCWGAVGGPPAWRGRWEDEGCWRARRGDYRRHLMFADGGRY